jgi:hypothetical protein
MVRIAIGARMGSIGFSRSQEQVKLDMCWTFVPMVRGCGALWTHAVAGNDQPGYETIAAFGGCDRRSKDDGVSCRCMRISAAPTAPRVRATARSAWWWLLSVA